MAKQQKDEQNAKNNDHSEIRRIVNHLTELGKLQIHLIGELKKHIEKPKIDSNNL